MKKEFSVEEKLEAISYVFQQTDFTWVTICFMNGWMHIEAKESQALSRKRKAEVSFLMKKDAKLFVNITKER